MKLELYLQNSNTGKVYNISDIAGQVKVTSSILGEAGKLECILYKDPNNLLQIANGSIVSFIVDGVEIFFGYIFTIGTDAEENYKITCYDQMRYLKNDDVRIIKNMTSSDIFANICKEYNLKYKIKVPTSFIPPPYSFKNGTTLYSMIKRGMDLASINDRKQYFIKDEFGTLVWSELAQEKTNIQLGDGSLLTGYKYEKSIDSDTFNQIKLYHNDEDNGKRTSWVVKNSDTIMKWGILQLLVEVDENYNLAQIQQQGENYLKLKNRETEKLKLQANGIKELTAGKGIKFVLPREGIDRWMWITNATHTYTKYEHSMELEVAI